MNDNIILIAQQLPREMPFTDIEQFEQFEERFFAIEMHFGDIVGMCLDYVEFCPNHNPPEIQAELLPWLWLIRPSMKNEIFIKADKRLRSLIQELGE